MKFDGSHGGLLFAGFNQDYSRLTVGTKSGYRIYNVDPFRQLFSDKDSANIVQMLFNTSLVAHVGAGSEADSSQRCLRMINTKRKKEIIRMNYRTTVLAVKLNRSRLVLVLEKDIYIYDITNMKLVHVINATPENKNGVCALASCHVPGAETTDGCLNLLAYPGSDVKGNVYLYDTVNLRLMHMIEAHQSVVSCLEFNNRGDLLATASEKGTVFRVFRTPKGEKLFELRRGFKTFANVSSMCFSADSRFISVSSDKATIHVFKLEEPKPADTSSWTGYVTNGLGTVASYLPTSVTEVWTQARSFAMVQLPTPVPNLAALIGTGPVPVLLLVTEEGNLYRYKIPLEGGECVPDGSHRLDDYSQPSEGEGEGAAAAAAAATAGGAGGVGGGVGAAEEAAEDKAAATFAEAVSNTAAKAEAGGDA